ncbi:SRPBCC family protein [Nocardia sp. NPDC057227]|uniref:SRPBCC family protein n=1 Tax=Nocardia sp. NPDC057227 TaxID=3346056 RepID=UPI003644FD7B
MKYTNSIEIALPRERVAQLLADPVHIPKWLRGVVRHEPVKGVHGELGTESRVVLRTGNREVECTETITRREPAELRDIPAEVVVHFDREIVGAGMWSAVRDRLTEAGPEATHWESESEYRFDSRLIRLLGRLLPGSFRRQSQQHMRDFKAFAEEGRDVREGSG